MKKTAILIDGEWFRRGLQATLTALPGPHGITADVMYRNALLTLDNAQEELYRIYYYDCPPYSGQEVNPISRVPMNFKTQPKHHARTMFLNEMMQLPFVALRLGVARRRGWHLKDQWVQAAIKGTVTTAPASTDVFLSLEQKGVDMRLGIDVATLALKEQVERIIVISGDTDMVPAMKLARREGVQVILTALQGWVNLSRDLIEDADVVRSITSIP
jgi:uncharacterized LabA/DUF88 family protein